MAKTKNKSQKTEESAELAKTVPFAPKQLAEANRNGHTLGGKENANGSQAPRC
jgi:hypothetical protein